MIGKLRNTFKSVFWYAFIKDFKSHKVAFSVACIGIIYIVVFGIFGENAEPWFPYADQIDNVLKNLSYSYVAAYIFFVMTTSIKYASDKRKCYEMSKRTLEIVANRVGMFFFYAGLDVGPSNIKNWPDRKGSFNASEASLSNLDKFFKQKKLSDSTPRISPPMDYLSAIKYTYQQVLNDESRFS
ncbi:hypothetical protein [Motilimonas eburnea]|uniref:hypothetical protein n=1 Tax=Motilimonas eburnea TaxID=1737488 RepID=UPI001E60B74F|nr:hypothetical protein [Motilimonas eburnea]MCE2569899.1 hypothetical protein [Motilimonas eburnea]